ncbi:glycoside hydrolase family 28 protein [Ramaria rubella]|nr:glycoside hydrolase family 28 protein [Ramaria rubella]
MLYSTLGLVLVQAVSAAAVAAVAQTGGADSRIFVVPHKEGADDAIAVRAALAEFNSSSTILFEKGKTYNIWTPLDFGTLTNVEVAIEGNITLPSNISEVQALVGSSSFPGAWFTLAGINVTLRGTTNPNWGWIDGHGQAWWDAVQQTNRPHGWKVTSDGGGIVKDIKIWKPIGWNWAFSGNDIQVSNIRIMAVSSTSAFPFNTDGFTADGSNIVIENSHVENGDDCFTVTSGANGVTFRNNYCAGGHGLSIGSLGSGGSVAAVSNILIENNVMVNSLYGARFKSWLGGKGAAVNVTWRNIALKNVPFPIYVTQNYVDQETSGPMTPTANSSSTHIENFLFENFTGTLEDVPFTEGSCISDPCWYAVPGATGKEVVIFDLFPGTATNIVAKNLAVVTETGAPLRVICNSTDVTGNVGFKCVDGLYRPTPAGL